MNKSDLLLKTANNVQNLLNKIKLNQVATQKAASMVEAGVLNDSDRDKFSNLFSNGSQHDLDLVSQAIGITSGKSQTGWGVEEESNTDNAFFDPDNRYARLDAIIMGGGQF